MSEATSLHLKEQADSQTQHLQAPSMHIEHSDLSTTFPQVGVTAEHVELGSLKEIHPSRTDPKAVDSHKQSDKQLRERARVERPRVNSMPMPLKRLDRRGSHVPEDRLDAPVTMFQGATNIHIDGRPIFENNYNVHHQGGSQDIESFKQLVSFDALHDAAVQDIDRYVDHIVREAAVKQMKGWIDRLNAAERIVWLHGREDIGKTAITLEIARHEKVAATFFFNRSDPGRNDGNRLFPTLAWQLKDSIPDIGDHILKIINKFPDLSKKRIDEQFQYLIAQPFLEVEETVQPSDLVVVIDALDECADVRLQQKILEAIGKAIMNRHIQLRFIICSRSDAPIQKIFNQLRCPILAIDLANFDPAEEIRKREEKITEREEELKEEERQLKEEQYKLKEDERKLKEKECKLKEDAKRMESEIVRMKEGVHQRQAELERREVNLADEMRQKTEEIKRREAELKRREEEHEQRQLRSHVEIEPALIRLQEERRQLEHQIKLYQYLLLLFVLLTVLLYHNYLLFLPPFLASLLYSLLSAVLNPFYSFLKIFSPLFSNSFLLLLLPLLFFVR